MTEWVWVILLTLAPTLELRASIPYAILGAQWSPAAAAAAGIAANTLLAPVLWPVVDRIVGMLRRVGPLDRLYQRYAERKRASLQRLVDRYGVLGLALFIGVPLPGTGVYSGALAARLLEMRFRDFLLGSFLGCLMAGTLVTLAVASGSEAFSFFYKGGH